jgi:SH3 domain protein
MEKARFNPTLHPGLTSALFLCCMLIMIIFANLALAQTWYIRPASEIPLRRGQGSDYKILAIVPDGTAVSIIEENETWAKVVTDDKREGWILKRYLTEDPPLEIRLDSLQKENTALKATMADLRLKNEELSAFNTAMQNTLDHNQEQLAVTTDKYQELVNDTADVITIKSNLDQSKQTIAKLQQELGSVTAENKRLKASQNIKWFLAGGGTLIFGCIAGMIFSQSKKRKSSLY